MSETDQQLGKFTAVERSTLKMAESGMSNYRNAELALLDLVDNAVDNRIEGKLLTIKIIANKNVISIHNQGGEGLNLEGLENFLNWGHSEKSQRQIGQYGVGGKSAMGALGQAIEIRCSPKDMTVEYLLEDKDWSSKPEESEKEHEGDARRTEVTDGYFRVTITRLRKRIDTNLVVARLGEIYRPLLVKGEVEIYVNNRKVEPFEIKYLETDPDFSPIRRPNDLISGWGYPIPLVAGILMDRGSANEAGMRLYYRGRLITKNEFLGHPTPSSLPQASRFVGEASLDYVGVTTNKSDFIDDIRFEDAVAVLREATRPLIDKLYNLKIEQMNQIERYEVNVTKDAKRNLEHILNHNPELLNRARLGGESRGRLPGSPRTEPSSPSGITGRSQTPTEGATPPDLRATAGPNVKRWGPFANWEPVSMGVDEVACEIVELTGNRQSLKINIDYPMYQAEKIAGDDALELYVLETAISAIGKELFAEASLDEYFDWVQKARQHIGIFYAHKLTNVTSRRSKR